MSDNRVTEDLYMDIECDKFVIRVSSDPEGRTFLFFLYRGDERLNHDSDLFAFYVSSEGRLIFFEESLDSDIYKAVSEFVRRDRQKNFGGKIHV